MREVVLTGAVALVTGAGGGIGAATARRLAREGAAVALVAHRRERLDALARGIAGTGGTALVVEADSTDPDPAAAAVQATLERFGRLDMLINGTGIMLLGTALHATIEDWDRMIALNVGAVLHVTHAAVPYLIDAAATSPRGVADIVNVSSTAGRVARPGGSAYTLTMFGLTGFTEALRQELLVEGVRVSVVEPGTVGTGLLPCLGDAEHDAQLALGTRVDPSWFDDIADAIAFIVTRERRTAINQILVRARPSPERTTR
jgi:NADP-dependent 3-hydroxy acid dehydrogenase YdfG